MNREDFYFQLAFSMAVMATICLFITACQRDKLKEDAVERGYAEYVVDSDGKKTWQWKEKEQ